MLKTKKQLIPTAAFCLIMFAATNLFAGTKVYISYSSGSSCYSPPVRTCYVYRPAVVYTVPAQRCITVCDTPRVNTCSSSFSISYNSGFDRDYRRERFYYNPPRSHRFDHRRNSYRPRRW